MSGCLYCQVVHSHSTHCLNCSCVHVDRCRLLVFLLQSNRLTKIEGLECLTHLDSLYLSHNAIEKLEGLENNVSVLILARERPLSMRDRVYPLFCNFSLSHKCRVSQKIHFSDYRSCKLAVNLLVEGFACIR